MRLNLRREDITLDGETAKNSSLQGLPFVDVDESTIPANRSQRHKWRVKNGEVKIDPSVPDPPHPRQALLARAATANTVGELKQVLVDLIRQS